MATGATGPEDGLADLCLFDRLDGRDVVAGPDGDIIGAGASGACPSFMTLSRLPKTPFTVFDRPLRAPALLAAAAPATPYSTIAWPAAGPAKTSNNRLLKTTAPDRIVIDPPSVQPGAKAWKKKYCLKLTSITDFRGTCRIRWGNRSLTVAAR